MAAVEAKTKNAWAKELTLVVSFSGWGLHIITATVSSYSKYATMINKAAPYNYPNREMPGKPSNRESLPALKL
uniref:NADH dehydrogenase [ubiquinone] 1 alpha subcomplex subunit 3 n=1 Tax=Peromyscus maniculatus bairdii TaxID=230844 RepID=A0A8C8W638_PERMB